MLLELQPDIEPTGCAADVTEMGSSRIERPGVTGPTVVAASALASSIGASVIADPRIHDAVENVGNQIEQHDQHREDER